MMSLERVLASTPRHLRAFPLICRYVLHHSNTACDDLPAIDLLHVEHTLADTLTYQWKHRHTSSILALSTSEQLQYRSALQGPK